MDEVETREPDLLGSVFMNLTWQQVGEVRRTGDNLLLHNLAPFLEKYSGIGRPLPGILRNPPLLSHDQIVLIL
jgi:hypothetical protein